VTDERVRVEISRAGGFAGMTRSARADTAELDESRAAELRRLVEAVPSGGSKEDRPDTSASRGADRFQFDVTIRRGTHVEALGRREPDLTSDEQRLVRWVLDNDATQHS
jgi:hypothetical protein